MNDCKFTLNNQPMSKFEIDGFRFNAFSGDGKDYVNRPATICVKDDGAIPIGSYYILDRQQGGILGEVRDWFHSFFNLDRRKWFALYAKDKHIDDIVFCNSVQRGQFRLHPKGRLGLSKGCITIDSINDFEIIRNHLHSKPQFKIPNSQLLAYSIVNVVASPFILQTK
jgi:hypothetical protein